MTTIETILARLREANAGLATRAPEPTGERQPVHTVYAGAHLFRADAASRFGRLALEALDTWAPTAGRLAEAIGLEADAGLVEAIDRRVREKLEREPVEDLRLDFEDGYGHRPDDEEDECAVTAAAEVAEGLHAGTLPPFIGIRIKPLSGELHRRAVRTLERFVGELLRRTGGALPGRFVVTIPKVMIPEQAAAAAAILAELERSHGLAENALRLELMVETTEAVIGADGRCALPLLADAAGPRCIGMHFGVYDYTAACGITAEHQRMTHPACDFARHAMQVTLARTGLMLSDGATNVMPVPVHRAEPLSAARQRENREAVHRAWRMHYGDVRHSLVHGFYQGWDLHPAQLPTRYAAVFAFFLESLDAAAERLASFVEQAARATLVGSVFDDAATGQGLLEFFLRGVSSGAITEAEAMRSGLTVDELRGRSFARVLERRSRTR